MSIISINKIMLRDVGGGLEKLEVEHKKSFGKFLINFEFGKFYWKLRNLFGL